jgi:hypothetical protein
MEQPRRIEISGNARLEIQILDKLRALPDFGLA